LKVDAHQHFWKYDPQVHAWIDESMATLRRDHLPAELRAHLDREGIDGCVAVQVEQHPGENHFLRQLTDEHPWILGFVGWVDLCSAGVDEELAELSALGGAVGVRHIVQDEKDDRFLMGEEFRRGVGRIPEHGLTYDLLIHQRHLPVAIEFVASLPDVPMVLDHIAKPLIAEGTLEPWATHIGELARFENLSCKLSGMVTEAKWQEWTPADLAPYIEVALEAFGPDRLMFGSDWPVCRLAGDYAAMRSAVEPFLEQISGEERARIEGGTATGFYRLGRR